ncbi:MAG: hypothetical protein IKM55_01380 [Bacilli bacterium]|nr:hypothetical protein [Bacillota bacterium]MBR6820856.1 hypothetical protein [Bacilli bacterium]
MTESYWGYWFILLGVFITMIMILSNDATTTDTQDYYQLKEVANSALYDAVDYSYYSQTRQVRILKEVFVENFLRRFAETVNITDSYKVEFYDLYESPPKVSVKVATTTAGYFIGRDTDVVSSDGTVINNAATKLDVVNTIDLTIDFNATERNCDDKYKCTEKIDSCTYYTK